MDIQTRVADLAERVDRAISELCDTRLSGPELLQKAIRYSLEAGGKRLRPALTILSCEACGGHEARAMGPAVAIEMVHTFSLIHDDLPAMDDDDVRRGQATSHKVFGEANAILAGDTMVIAAFEVLATLDQDPALTVRMVEELARASGGEGMAGGQILDINYDSANSDPAVAEKVHRLKTGQMIRCSCRMGALAAGADDERLERLGDFGMKLGLAFQIIDDLLDVVGTAEQVGKGTGKDADAGKPNYALLEGVDEARRRAEELIAEGNEQIEPLGRDAGPLVQLARWMLNRRK